MSRISQSLDLFVLSCLFLTVESQTGHILPPQNVSLVWITAFQPQLSWAPPPHSMENCGYEVFRKTNKTNSTTKLSADKLSVTPYVLMGGGFLQMSVKTVCGGTMYSEPRFINITYPELVTDLQCFIHSSKETNCSWHPASHSQDLRVFYRLVDQDFRKSVNDTSHSLNIQECRKYSSTGGIRTGCSLTANVNQDLDIVFNVLDNKPVRNTFRIELIDNVRPPPLNWTVTKTGDEFNISWTPPDVLHVSDWKFIINYTECNEKKYKDVHGETTTTLRVVSHCQYWITIKAVSIGGETPWSYVEFFGADTDPNTLLYAVFIIPVVVAGLAALFFVFCRKNKEIIFPKVPEPRDFLSDIFDNNNKSAVRNLYIPAEEEDSCKITLVIDTQTSNLSS